MNNTQDNSLAVVLHFYLLDEVEFFLFSLLENCYVFVFFSPSSRSTRHLKLKCQPIKSGF